MRGEEGRGGERRREEGRGGERRGEALLHLGTGIDIGNVAGNIIMTHVISFSNLISSGLWHHRVVPLV